MKKGTLPIRGCPFFCVHNQLRARFLRQVGGAEEERGGVAALRRTIDDEGNAEMAQKARSHYRIISKKRSSHVSSVISMNLLQMVESMFNTPW